MLHVSTCPFRRRFEGKIGLKSDEKTGMVLDLKNYPKKSLPVPLACRIQEAPARVIGSTKLPTIRITLQFCKLLPLFYVLPGNKPVA